MFRLRLPGTAKDRRGRRVTAFQLPCHLSEELFWAGGLIFQAATMQAPDNNTPASESHPAASATPPPVPVGSNQPPSLKDVWNDAKGSFTKLNKEEKTGCGCGIMVLVALCFLLGKCSCSDSSKKGGSDPTPSGKTPVGENAANQWTPENVRAALNKMDSTLPLFAGGTQGLFDVVERLRDNEIETEKLKSEIVLHKDDENGTWMVDNVVNDAVIYSYRLTPAVPWDKSRMIRIAVLREDGEYYAEDTDLPAGRFLFMGITSFTTVAGIETQIPAFRQVK